MGIVDLDKRLLDTVRRIAPHELSDEEILSCEDFLALGFSSISLMELVFACEEEFKMEFVDEDLTLEVLGQYENVRRAIRNQGN